ncbi:NAD(P)H-dependent oxidoreductase [Bermanella sp. R86510]|uniref:NAD(P)H-dependent oxidoreductase n=1 Tax=unclassified Bermanella TaxID=2627862 RepID=UPI0037CCAD8A
MAKVLILFAHPSPVRSEVNLPLFKNSKMHDVTRVDLYGEYPNFRIDIDKEQHRLREHDVIVFMFPMYWYSTPAILKEWQDLVLEYGFAYGKNGNALQGKRFFCSFTTGGAEKAYQDAGYNHYTVNQLLQPLEQTAFLSKMQYLPPFVLFSARTAREDNRLTSHISQWRRILQALVDDRITESDLKGIEKLNDIKIEDAL